MGGQNCLRDVDVLPGRGTAVHQRLALVEPHELLVGIPVVLPASHGASVQAVTQLILWSTSLQVVIISR